VKACASEKLDDNGRLPCDQAVQASSSLTSSCQSDSSSLVRSDPVPPQHIGFAHFTNGNDTTITDAVRVIHLLPTRHLFCNYFRVKGRIIVLTVAAVIMKQVTTQQMQIFIAAVIMIPCALLQVVNTGAIIYIQAMNIVSKLLLDRYID